MFDESKQFNMTELVFMATELIIRSEAEEKGLDKKIKDQGFYDHIIKNLASQFMLTTFVLDNYNKENGVDSKGSTEMAHEKAKNIVFKTIKDISDALESKEEGDKHITGITLNQIYPSFTGESDGKPDD